MIDIWHIWVIAGIILSILEIFTMGFAVMFLALGAFASAGAAALDYNWQAQAAVFTLVSVLSTFALRPFIIKLLHPHGGEDKVNSMTGKKAMVTVEIPGSTERGKVKFEGEEWPALSELDLPIPSGKQVLIKKMEGNTLVVELEKE